MSQSDLYNLQNALQISKYILHAAYSSQKAYSTPSSCIALQIWNDPTKRTEQQPRICVYYFTINATFAIKKKPTHSNTNSKTYTITILVLIYRIWILVLSGSEPLFP